MSEEYDIIHDGRLRNEIRTDAEEKGLTPLEARILADTKGSYIVSGMWDNYNDTLDDLVERTIDSRETS